MSGNGDWISRVIIPDMYPRRQDPYKPGPGVMPSTSPNAGTPPTVIEETTEDVLAGWLTNPRQRPLVYQRAINYQMTAGTSPRPLVADRFPCDTMVVTVPAAAVNSVFFGYGGAITVDSGVEVQPGLPLSVAVENTRQLWEIQRTIEILAGMIAADRGYPAVPGILAPRLALNAGEYYVVAPAATLISVMLFPVPELQ